MHFLKLHQLLRPKVKISKVSRFTDFGWHLAVLMRKYTRMNGEQCHLVGLREFSDAKFGSADSCRTCGGSIGGGDGGG